MEIMLGLIFHQLGLIMAQLSLNLAQVGAQIKIRIAKVDYLKIIEFIL